MTLADRVIGCHKCPRLTEYCKLVGERKRKAFADWDYWAKPLPGFGDPKAKFLIIGLAPAANGGTRTGRIFCGDSSGDWLVRALYQTGFANQPISTSRDDGLKLTGVYLAAVVRCAPPKNKPTPQEVRNCLPYLGEELRVLRDVKFVMVLGRIAFQGFIKVLREEYGRDLRPLPKFQHGAVYEIGGGLPKLYVSYHPSKRNTQTKLLTWSMWIRAFREVRSELKAAEPITNR